MAKKKKGYIIPNGVTLEKHENKTVVFLAELGYIVELVPPRPQQRYIKTPDIKINKRYWEIKSSQQREIYNSPYDAGCQQAVEQPDYRLTAR